MYWFKDSAQPFLSHRELERELEKRMLGDMQSWTPQNSGVQNSKPDIGARPAAVEFSAHEGALKEQKWLTQGRNRALRDKAIQQAMGRCAACERDYSKVLEGAGERVLEVHHRRQLSLRKTPRLTRVADLAVVCANCHRLLHIKPGKTLWS